MENKELQNLLLHERKSSILNIHKISSLENELIAFKHKLEAEKYESEAHKALVLQLEHQLYHPSSASPSSADILNIQNEPQNILMMQSSDHQLQSTQCIQVRFVYLCFHSFIHSISISSSFVQNERNSQIRKISKVQHKHNTYFGTTQPSLQSIPTIHSISTKIC